MTIRRKYTKEFKLDAVSLVIDQGYSRVEAARSLDINANMLGRWVQEHQAGDGQTFRGNGKLNPEQEEIRKLKSQVKRLEMEKDILKKRRYSLQHKRSEIFVYHPTQEYLSHPPAVSGIGCKP